MPFPDLTQYLRKALADNPRAAVASMLEALEAADGDFAADDVDVEAYDAALEALEALSKALGNPAPVRALAPEAE